MTSADENPQGGEGPDFEVRYSERFSRERERSNRRGLLYGGLGFLVLGIVVIRDSIIAFHAGTLVSMGGMRSGPDAWSPVIAGPVGVFFAIIGVGLLGAWIFRRDRT